MEVIIIDQNKGDRFLIRYLLENQPGISTSLECNSPREATSYLKGMAEVNSTDRFVILCNERVGLSNGIQALTELRTTFPQMDLYTVLMQEDLKRPNVFIDPSLVDNRLEKKVELEEFSEEVGRVIVAAGRGPNGSQNGQSSPPSSGKDGPFMTFRSVCQSKRRLPFLYHLFPVAMN